MAHTARKGKEVQEFFDSPEELERKVSRLTEWVRESKHFFVFTGAGISTSAGIPDFRSGINTSLETGPGAWELHAHGKMRSSACHVTSTTKAVPTPTHMSFVRLCQEGLLKCVISQNCDGLHRRSGMPKEQLFELHGNSNVELCSKCGRDYLRDYRVRSAAKVHNHHTGNLCDDPKCKGKLKDSIINFGENLPEDTLATSVWHSEHADLCLAMGSSLTVTPAADIPEEVGKRGQKLVIVNLQRTPLDSYAKLRIFAKCDDVSRMLMSKLSLDIPEFRLRRRIHFSVTAKDQNKVLVQGVDVEGHPFSFIKEVLLVIGGEKQLLKSEPFVGSVKWGGRERVEVEVTLTFHAHYGEPPIKHKLSVAKATDFSQDLALEFNPFTREWSKTGGEGRGGEGRGAASADSLTEKMKAAHI